MLEPTDGQVGAKPDLGVVAEFLEPATGRLVDRVHAAVATALRRGAIPAGMRLIEADLALALDVSRTPVREALRRLEAEGLVRFSPNRGFIATNLMDDVEIVFLVRERLEGLAAGLAAKQITLDDLDQLREVQGRLESALAASPRRPDDLVRLNGEFHRLINRSANSERLLDLIERLQVDYVSYQVVAGYSDTEWRDSMREHRQILDALWNRDYLRVDSLVQQHLDRGKDIVMQAESPQRLP